MGFLKAQWAREKCNLTLTCMHKSPPVHTHRWAQKGRRILLFLCHLPINNGRYQFDTQSQSQESDEMTLGWLWGVRSSMPNFNLHILVILTKWARKILYCTYCYLIREVTTGVGTTKSEPQEGGQKFLGAIYGGITKFWSLFVRAIAKSILRVVIRLGHGISFFNIKSRSTAFMWLFDTQTNTSDW